MTKNLKFLNVFILLVLIILNSCSINDLPKDTKNKSLGTNSNLKIKNLPTLGFSRDKIELVSSDMDSSLTIEEKSLYPKNLSLNFKGMDINPYKLNTIVKKGFTQQEIDEQRKAYWGSWKTWYRNLYKMLRNKIIEVQKQEEILEKNKFEYNLKLYKKGSREYQNYIENFKKSNEERHKRYEEQRKQLKNTYKIQLEEIKKEIFTKLAKKKDFSIKAETCSVLFWSFDCDPLVQVSINIVKGLSPIVGIVSSIIDGIKNLMKNDPIPQPPPSVAQPNPNPTEDHISKSQDPQRATESQPQTSYTENISAPLKDKLKDNEIFVRDLIAQINNPDIKAIFGAVTAKQILGAIGVAIDPNKYANCGKYAVNTAINALNGNVSECDYALVALVSDRLNGIAVNSPELKEKFFITFKYFGARTNTKAWLKNLLDTYYYPEPELRTGNDYTKSLALIDKYANTTAESFIEGPELCKQRKKIAIRSENIFSFELKAPSTSLLFDGEYRVGLSIKDSSTTLFSFSENVNIAKALNKEINSNSSDLSISDLDYSSKDPVTDLFYNDKNKEVGVAIENRRGNLWDIKVEKIGDPLCKPVYTAECIDSASSIIKFNKDYLETGLYKISSNYSNPSNLDNLKNYKAYNNRTFSNTDYQFLVSHINYSTFSRLIEKPVDTDIQSINTSNNQNHLTTLFSFDDKNGTKSRYEIPDGSFLFFDDPEPLELYSPKIPTDTVLSKKVVKTMVTNLANPQISQHLSQASKDLFIDLSKPHLSSDNVDYDSFSRLNVKSCTTNKFINVGAVINITNKVFLNNKAISDMDRRIPMFLEIVDKNNPLESHVIKSWKVYPKIGEITVIQKYWDGTNNDFESLPDYTTGNYEVAVDIDFNEYLSNQSLISDSNRTYLTYPNISNSSTNSQLTITDDNSCPSLKILNAELTPEEKIEITGKLENMDLASFDYNSIKADFFGDVENINDKNIIQLGNGEFKLVFNSPKTTEQYNQKVFANGGFSEINLRISLCGARSACLLSEKKVLKTITLSGESESILLADGPIDKSYSIAAVNTSSSCRSKGIAPIASGSNVIIENPFRVIHSLPTFSQIAKKITGGNYKFEVTNKRTNKKVFSENNISFSEAGSTNKNIIQIKYTTLLPSGYAFAIPSVSLFYQWNGKINEAGSENGKMVLTDPYVSNITYSELYVKTIPNGFTYKVRPVASVQDNREYFILNMDEYKQRVDNLRNVDWASYLTGARKNSTLGSYRLEVPKLQIVGNKDAHSGFPTFAGVKSPSEYNRTRIFPPSTSIDPKTGKPMSENDTERKMIEDAGYLANNISGQNAYYNSPSNYISSNIGGRLLIYSDRKTCDRCQELPPQFRTIYPNIDLVWVDFLTKECY